MIRVAVLENQFEAELVAQVLDADGVDFVLKTFHDTAFDGIFETRKGYAWVLADEKDRAKIMQTVDEVRASKPIIDDNGEVEDEDGTDEE